MFPMLATVAMEWEGRSLCDRLTMRKNSNNSASDLYVAELPAGRLWVLVTGMGAAATIKSLERARGVAEPRSVVSVGVGGGLQIGLRTGELIVADSVLDENGAVFPCDDGLVEGYEAAAREAAVPVHKGKILTVVQVLATAKDKARAGERTGALAVDMEGAAAARWAAAAGIRFAAARVVLDGVDSEIPVAAQRMADAKGHLRPASVLGEILRHPTLVPRLVALGRETAACRRSLRSVHRRLFAAG